MQVFCINEFKVEFEKLISKKQYSTLEKEIIDYFFHKKIDELISGTRLNNSQDIPYIKKRLRGKGGFRLYFLVLIKNENIYLMFVHPKTGPYGASNITDESKAMLYKNVLKAIKNNDLYLVELEEKQKHLIFTKK
jgi:hypothetical protein